MSLSDQDLHFYPIPRSPEENQERAFIAASRRKDRSLDARVKSANRASSLHKRRTGKAFHITKEIVEEEGMYGSRRALSSKASPHAAEPNLADQRAILPPLAGWFSRPSRISLERTLHRKSARKQLGVPFIDGRQPAEVEFRFVKHQLILLAWCGCVGKYDGKC
ncbi:hypothetical protein N7489_005102 [Penicillium chrysogenum]|uniref:uncharacterized protein n=1 Tax=Penicillium chrysogenum TaxID=5076 RepID=UPI0024DF1344|nr:uncharacterized protein N7489_005102 [Penicillium chrysogenum]KAJ5245006.1 hypothetical protein N7489_005102 [Penicillium chrysogenum]KAJ5849159.1 hypothetical protein N7534_007848 [Penicillium rubens]